MKTPILKPVFIIAFLLSLLIAKSQDDNPNWADMWHGASAEASSSKLVPPSRYQPDQVRNYTLQERWETDKETVGSWIKIHFSQKHIVKEICILSKSIPYDIVSDPNTQQPCTYQLAKKVTLSFSDGSNFNVELQPNDHFQIIKLPKEKNTDYVKVTINELWPNSGTGGTGISKIWVYSVVHNHTLGFQTNGKFDYINGKLVQSASWDLMNSDIAIENAHLVITSNKKIIDDIDLGTLEANAMSYGKCWTKAPYIDPDYEITLYSGTKIVSKKVTGYKMNNPFFIHPRTGQQHIALDGDWELSYRDSTIENLTDLSKQSKWIKAQVPGSVQVALFRAGELPNPYIGMNAKKYAWVLGKTWYYRKSFSVPADVKDQYVFLCFDGIDYYASIWLNGKELGHHEGMHSGPMLEVGSLLKSDGINELVVEVRAANYGQGDKFLKREGTLTPNPPGDKVVMPWGLFGGLDVMTGGGWSPKRILPGREVSIEDYFPMGIWRPVRLEIVPRTHIERPFLSTEEANTSMARLRLNVEVQVNTTGFGTNLKMRINPWGVDGEFRNAWTSKPVVSPPMLRFQLLDKATGQSVLTRDIPLQLYEGRNWVRQEIDVASPKLWWPNGMGDPYLYRVRLSLIQPSKDDEKTGDTIEFDYGIRTISWLPAAGPQTQDRWDDWQFVVNGRKFFVKGMDWWTNDIFLDLPRDRYRWELQSAQAARIQLIRTWGGGIIETDDFYELCDQLGILVWEDFPVANVLSTEKWPQDIWEEQVMHTIFRIRNHPSLTLYSGGNETFPYTDGNAATTGILERSVKDFDGTRPFHRGTGDKGDIHTYPTTDPTWFWRLYPLVPYISEFGPHSVPEARSIREFVDPMELKGPLRDINSQEFMDTHPEFVYHYMEYGGGGTDFQNVLASQILDMKAPSLEDYSTASQVAIGEFIKFVSDFMQSNYPVSTGLSPWVFNTPWPLSTFCMFVDYDGQPVASYYFLKRTYEPIHVIAKLPQLMWAKGENVPFSLSVMNSNEAALKGVTASVQVFSTDFRSLFRAEKKMDVQAGLSVSTADLGAFTIPDELEDHSFLIVVELRQPDNTLISRSVYWPRCLKVMADEAFRTKYRSSPQMSLTFENGPWLRKEVQASQTKLDLQLVSIHNDGENESIIQTRIRNVGSQPAFYTEVGIEGTKRTFYASDNGFWLAPQEERLLDIHVWWRDPKTRSKAVLTLGAWNASSKQVKLGGVR